jgi:hypothetical protein
MTDQEMAVRLGSYIIKLQRDISALQGVIKEYRSDTPQGGREIPWREQAKRIAQDEGLQRIAVEQRRMLLGAIGRETQGSALIHGLYRQFLEED